MAAARRPPSPGEEETTSARSTTASAARSTTSLILRALTAYAITAVACVLMLLGMISQGHVEMQCAPLLVPLALFFRMMVILFKVDERDKVHRVISLFKFIIAIYTGATTLSPYSGRIELKVTSLVIPHVFNICLLASSMAQSQKTSRTHSYVYSVVIVALSFLSALRVVVGHHDFALEQTIVHVLVCVMHLISVTFLQSTIGDLESFRAELAHQLDMNQSLTESLILTREAMSRMLAGVFDCVCSLSADMCFTQVSPQLHNILMPERSTSSEDLFGHSICKFMGMEDLGALKQSILSLSLETVKNGTPAAVLPIIFHSTDGNRVPVHVYHTPLHDNEHIVAIRVRSIEDNERDKLGGGGLASRERAEDERSEPDDDSHEEDADQVDVDRDRNESCGEVAMHFTSGGYCRARRLSSLPEDCSDGHSDMEWAAGEELVDDAASGRHSVATTTLTNAVFRPGGCANSVAKSMQDIAKIGRRERWLIDQSDVELAPLKRLGRGGQSFVICGLLNGAPVAVKICKTTPERSKLVNMCGELQVLRRVRHPNIAMLYGACLCAEPADMAIVMELVDGVTLDSLCEVSPVPKPVLNFFQPGVAAAVHAGSSQRVGDVERQGFVHEVCSALAYLHALRPVCIHGDVKPANVMVERLQNRFRTKLIDFGLARNVTTDTMPLGGSWTWTAPEVLLGFDKPQTAADVFSFGRLAFFVVTGERPLKGSKFETMMKEMQEHSRLPGMDWPETCKLADVYRDLVVACCSWVSISRPSMREVALSLRAAGKGHAGDEESSLAGLLQHARTLQGNPGSSPCGEPNSISSRFRGGMDDSMA